MAGSSTCDGYSNADLYPSLINVPSEAMGMGTPRPIKARNASKKIALGMEKLFFTKA